MTHLIVKGFCGFACRHPVHSFTLPLGRLNATDMAATPGLKPEQLRAYAPNFVLPALACDKSRFAQCST